MKVYSWKTLLGTVIIAGSMLIYKLITFNISNDLYLDIAWIMLWCYLLFQGLRISLTKAGHEAEQARIKAAKKLRQKMVDKYGKLAYILLYSPTAVLILGAVISLILALASPHKLLAAIIFIAALVLEMCLSALVRSLVKKIKAE